MEEFWTPEDMLEMDAAKKFEDLSQIALRIVRRMPQPVGQVCGPITTGGVGPNNKEANLAVFHHAIWWLKSYHRLNIFNQLPFEPALWRIQQGGKDETNLLYGFYLPIFQSGLIKTMYFIFNWQTSYGAQWEHELARKLNIQVVYLAHGTSDPLPPY